VQSRRSQVPNRLDFAHFHQTPHFHLLEDVSLAIILAQPAHINKRQHEGYDNGHRERDNGKRESGSGKEVIARFIHDQSERAQAPFIAINW